MKNEKGFTLLIAIVTTSMLLLISFVIVNIALKQLILAGASRESQFAYYNAESGIECAMYWDFKNGSVSAFDLNVPTNVASCNGTSFPSGGSATTTFRLTLPKGYVDVSVSKSVTGTTTISSKGYNTSVGGSIRKFERGIQVVY